MALSAVIGALRVNLGIDTAAFSNGLKGADKSLARFGAGVARGAAIASAALSGVGAAASAAFMRVSRHADKMTKAAQEIGIPVEELTALTHAVELSGGDFGKLQVGIGRFAKNASDSMNGLMTEGTRALDSLGVSLTDTQGNVRATSEVIQDIADRFQAMPDGMQKTALAMQVFGRSGRDLIPMLNQGGAGIRAMMLEAQQLGIVISKDTGQAAERFNDNLLRMQRVFTGIANAVFARVVPVMASLSERFLSAMREGGRLQAIVDVLTGAFNGMVRAIMFVTQHLGTLYNLFKIFVAAKIGTFLIGAAGAFISLARAIRVTGIAMGAFITIKRAGVKGIAILAGIIAMATGRLDEMAAAIDTIAAKILDVLPESVFTFFGDIELETRRIAEGGAIILNSMDNAAASMQNATGVAEGLGKAVSAIGDHAEDAWYGLRKVSEDGLQTMQPIVNQLSSAFSSWVDSAIDGTFDLKEAVADLARDMLKMLANQAIQQLLMAAVGGSAAAGVGFGMTLPAFANGGSFKVGGTGGIDSQVVAFRASPNESVHVTKPGQMLAGGGSPTINIDARGAAPGAEQRIRREIDNALAEYSRGSYDRFRSNHNRALKRDYQYRNG